MWFGAYLVAELREMLKSAINMDSEYFRLKDVFQEPSLLKLW